MAGGGGFAQGRTCRICAKFTEICGRCGAKFQGVWHLSMCLSIKPSLSNHSGWFETDSASHKPHGAATGRPDRQNHIKTTWMVSKDRIQPKTHQRSAKNPRKRSKTSTQGPKIHQKGVKSSLKWLKCPNLRGVIWGMLSGRSFFRKVIF